MELQFQYRLLKKQHRLQGGLSETVLKAVLMGTGLLWPGLKARQLCFDCYNMKRLPLFVSFKTETLRRRLNIILIQLAPQSGPADAELLGNFGLIPCVFKERS
jgi:hypothetical protein